MTMYAHSMADARRASRLLTALFVAGALLGSVAALAADDFPIPLLMKDLPPDRGSWQMDLLESSRASNLKDDAGGHMKLCQTAAQATRHHHQDKAGDSACSTRMLENSTSRAVIESTCKGPPPRVSRVTITRDGARSFVVTEDSGAAADSDKHTKLRMSYLGPCSEKDAAVTLDRNSQTCQQARAHLAEMDPEKSCSYASGDKHAQCVQMMQRMREQVAATCGN